MPPAQAIRWLNHATINHPTDGYVYPGDVDETLAAVQVLLDRLPQALRQMSGWLDRQSAAGRVRHDAYPDREESAHQARGAVLILVGHLDTACTRLAVVGAD